MLTKTFALGAMAAAILAVIGLTARADEDEDLAALAKALPGATVSLDQGLKASEREGRPISGKYEIENGAFQLSVYTESGGQFREVIVDHRSGSIKKAEPITDADDLKDAQEQREAMAKAKLSLGEAVQNAVAANSGYRAVSVVPMANGTAPVASVILMKDENVKKVTIMLD